MGLVDTPHPINIAIVIGAPQAPIQSSHDLIHGSMLSRGMRNPILHRRSFTCSGAQYSPVPNGRKVLEEKVITHTPDLMEHVRDGGIVIGSLCGVDAREQASGVEYRLPRIVYHLLSHLFEAYMRDGALPENAAFIQ